jgi:Raf kinase inhibitor-like YbhB/YbcL family protein
VRRIALITSFCLVPLVIGGCKHDGRNLPPPRDDQNQSISSLSQTTEATTDPFATDGLDTTPPSIGSLTLTAPWRDGAEIDARYTCDGTNVSPALSWSAAPEGTVEIAITLSDLDVPGFVHWAIAGIAPTAVTLAEDTVPLGAYEAANSLGDTGYTGPCPPAGTQHLYLVTVHYLGDVTGLGDGAPGLDMVEAIEAAEIARAEVSGIFSRA